MFPQQDCDACGFSEIICYEFGRFNCTDSNASISSLCYGSQQLLAYPKDGRMKKYVDC